MRDGGYNGGNTPTTRYITNGTLTATIAEQLATITTGYTPDSEHELQEPSYYDYPVLKAPVWRWEIIWYFFFGGLAAGCYVIASIAALFGSREDRARGSRWILSFTPLSCYHAQYFLSKI